MSGFWNYPWDETRFNNDATRAMLMAIILHIFKDLGFMGSIGVVTLCFVWAFFQGYIRYRDAIVAKVGNGRVVEASQEENT